VDPVRTKASAAADAAALQAKVVSTEARVVDDAAAAEKRLVNFETKLAVDLAGLCGAYECNIHSIDGLCSPVSNGDPSVIDYLRWLATEVNSLPEVFAGVNENFTLAAIEGAHVMGGDAVNLAALQASTVACGAEVLPGG
jgi:hypothetical protein